MSDDDISRYRQEIDGVDRRIVELLNERARLAIAIGKLKGGGPVYRPEREAEVLRNVAAATIGPLSAGSLGRIYGEVMSACRALEGRISVGYLGPQGTFTEMAVARHFGHDVDAVPCGSIDEVVRKAETGSVQFAVLPVENSTEGAIGRTMDLLVSTSLRICGEVVLKVRQNLMAAVDKPPRSFVRVYSHAQSLGQCASWLAQNMPNAERIAVSSNAEAARVAAGEEDSCAIGPEAAAMKYGLKLLATDVQDDAKNMTRFLVLGKGELRSTGQDRTSLVMSAPNRPGAVLELISPFAQNGVSMTRIESRPARTGQWEYLFFVDIEGHQADPPVAKALGDIRTKAPFLKVLGSYPAAQSTAQ
jgi:chorismate mutase/prephenate dehydratase